MVIRSPDCVCQVVLGVGKLAIAKKERKRKGRGLVWETYNVTGTAHELRLFLVKPIGIASHPCPASVSSKTRIMSATSLLPRGGGGMGRTKLHRLEIPLNGKRGPHRPSYPLDGYLG